MKKFVAVLGLVALTTLVSCGQETVVETPVVDVTTPTEVIEQNVDAIASEVEEITQEDNMMTEEEIISEDNDMTSEETTQEAETMFDDDTMTEDDTMM